MPGSGFARHSRMFEDSAFETAILQEILTALGTLAREFDHHRSRALHRGQYPLVGWPSLPRTQGKPRSEQAIRCSADRCGGYDLSQDGANPAGSQRGWPGSTSLLSFRRAAIEEKGNGRPLYQQIRSGSDQTGGKNAIRPQRKTAE